MIEINKSIDFLDEPDGSYALQALPGNHHSQVRGLQQVEQVINDPQVAVRVKGHLAVDSQRLVNPSDSWGYKVIEKTIRELRLEQRSQ